MPTHKWKFRPSFRRGSFGWRSQPAITRVKEAVAEIKGVAKSDPVLAAEGAVLFFERVSPALEQVDSSSGAIGTAVYNALEDLVPVIADAPATKDVRQGWLERLYQAHQDDAIPYIERLGDYWGQLCAGKELASHWADKLTPTLKMAWSSDKSLRGFFHGTTLCLSALVVAERFDEVLALLKMDSHPIWPYTRFGVEALAAKGQWEAAIDYAESHRGLNDSPYAIARACEEILLNNGRVEEAYERYGFAANQRGTYLATLRAIAKKYPSKDKATILRDLVRQTPGAEGKWFAAAKDAGLLDQALELAACASADPKTLARAACQRAPRVIHSRARSGIHSWAVTGRPKAGNGIHS